MTSLVLTNGCGHVHYPPIPSLPPSPDPPLLGRCRNHCHRRHRRCCRCCCGRCCCGKDSGDNEVNHPPPSPAHQMTRRRRSCPAHVLAHGRLALVLALVLDRGLNLALSRVRSRRRRGGRVALRVIGPLLQSQWAIGWLLVGWLLGGWL